MKKLLTKLRSDRPHWVGDGFPVRSIFSYHTQKDIISPFLLLDYAGPTEFSATSSRRGVGAHPHRGFETVTIVYDGGVEHRDSAGGGGMIGPGDVQWMTAGSGVIHEEFHSRDFAKNGGRFEMIQLWVNLPKKFKMTDPRYQTLKNENIPVKSLNEGKASVRVIAGNMNEVSGPAKVFSPINLWDIKVNEDTELTLDLPENHHASLMVLDGEVTVGDEKITSAEIAIFETVGSKLQFKAAKGSKILFMGGEVISDPVVGYGPFVMNSRLEIAQAMRDYEAGKMGQLPSGV